MYYVVKQVRLYKIHSQEAAHKQIIEETARITVFGLFLWRNSGGRSHAIRAFTKAVKGKNVERKSIRFYEICSPNGRYLHMME